MEHIKSLNVLSPLIVRNYEEPRKRIKIAIVGNSGVNINEENEILDSDIVVRFNNYATRQGINHTKNRFKCDVLFTTFDLHSQGCAPKDVVIGIPYPFKAERIIKKSKEWYSDSRLWMVNPYVNLLMCRDLNINSDGWAHPFPSIGFTALYHMKDYDVDFYVTGFRWYYENGKFQGWNLKNKNYPSNWNHNYPKEVEWCVKNILRKNNFKFSEKTESILRIAERMLK